MKNTVIATLMLLSLGSWAAASERRDADIDRIQTASTVLGQIMSAPDRGIPDGIMSGAKCIAIIPSALKASFIVGANYGKGVATCRTDKGWSAPAFFKLTGGSFGFQAGGQASDLVLIIRTDEGMRYLLQSKFKLGADASAAAGPVGRDAQASTDLTLRAQVLTYSRSRGLFLGISLSGGVIKQDDADTQAFYGKTWTYRSVLNGEIRAPKDAEPLLQTVEKYAPTPKRAATPTAAAAPRPAGEQPASAPAVTASNTAAPVPGPPATEPVGAQEPATAAPAATPTATPARNATPVAAPPQAPENAPSSH